MAIAVLAVSMVGAACAGSAGAGGGDGPLSLRITSPADGAKISQPLTVSFDSSEPIGDPSTGLHHVHLCFDGESCDTEYTLVFADTFEVSGLAAGSHTIEASLRNADHSSAGAEDRISVTVTNGASGSTPTVAPGAGDTGGSGRYGD